jgi:hypothetical protein
MSGTTEEDRALVFRRAQAYGKLFVTHRAAGTAHAINDLDAAIDALVARAREEGAREATMRLKNRLIAVQMTLGDLWNRVDTFDPRMAPDLEEVVKLALEPNP